MYKTTIRFLSVPAFALLVVAAAQADVGRVWTYAANNGGYFEQRNGDQWFEFVNNSGGVTFNFREVNRTADAVVLYDSQRQLWVRISGDTSQIRFAGTGGWQFLYGRCTSAVVRIAGWVTIRTAKIIDNSICC